MTEELLEEGKDSTGIESFSVIFVTEETPWPLTTTLPTGRLK
jgi:hypothetical protein